LGIYAFHTLLKYKILPKQYVIYLGEKPLKMDQETANDDKSISLAVTNIQPRLEWNAQDFLNSNIPDEILWAIF
jgi:hypothetical protein